MATIDLNLLRTFAAVYEAGGFAAAAARLGVPRSTVSRAVAALEERVGNELFYRTTRRVAATEEGKALFDRVAPALAGLAAALDDLPTRREEPTGTVKVTATVDVAGAVLAEAAVRFAARYPKAKVEVLLTPELVDLAREGVDLALRIATGRLRDSGLVARKAGAVDFQLFAAPAYLARRGAPRSADDFGDHEWAGYRGAAPARLGEALRAGAAVARARIACDDMFFLREVLRRGGGIGAMPSFVAADDVSAGTLVRVLPRWTVPLGTVYLVHVGRKHLPPRVGAFRDLVLELLRQRPLAPPGAARAYPPGRRPRLAAGAPPAPTRRGAARA